MANTTTTKLSPWAQASKFFRETWLELRKTAWPTKDELQKSTLLVLAAVAVITLFIGGLDALLSWITQSVGLK